LRSVKSCNRQRKNVVRAKCFIFNHLASCAAKCKKLLCAATQRNSAKVVTALLPTTYNFFAKLARQLLLATRCASAQHTHTMKQLEQQELARIVRAHSYDETAAAQLLENKQLARTVARALAKVQHVGNEALNSAYSDALGYLVHKLQTDEQQALALRVLASYVATQLGETQLRCDVAEVVKRCSADDYAAMQLLCDAQALAVLAKVLDLVSVTVGSVRAYVLAEHKRTGKRVQLDELWLVLCFVQSVAMQLLKQQLAGEAQALALEVLKRFTKTL
jgi:hypothetical protein